MSLRTGQKVVTKLRKYINGYSTTEVKDNTSGDANYIAPYADELSCPKYQIETVEQTLASTTTLSMYHLSTATSNPPEGWTSNSLACNATDVNQVASVVNFTQNVSRWQDVVDNNLTIYVDSGTTTAWSTTSYYRTEASGISGYSFKITNGVLSDWQFCGPAPPVPVTLLPVSVVVTEEVPPDQSTVCQPCFTTDLPEKECITYEVEHAYSTPQAGVDPLFMDVMYSYTNCETGLIIESDLSIGQTANVNSLTRPQTVIGPTIRVTEGQVVEGYSNTDINQYHYLASGCYDSDSRHLRSETQFNVGDIVKTGNSSCCWEIIQIVPPQPAYDIIFNSASDIYDSCTSCCDTSAPSSTYGQVGASGAVINGGNVTLSHSNGISIKSVKTFQITNAGSVEIKLTLQLTTGNYVRAAGRVKQADGLTKNTIVEFPVSKGVIPFVENKDIAYGGTGSDVVEAKTVNLKAGIYKVEIDPLEASSNAFGSATITVKPS